MSVDRKAAEQAISDFLKALGRDPSADPELAETPRRVVDAFSGDLLSGYAVDIERLVLENSSVVERAAPADSAAQLVVVDGIRVETLCPHHLMPALGVAKVAYLPGTRLLGIGVVARLIQAYARRLILQEALGQGVTSALMGPAGAEGAYVQLDLMHTCLSARGVREHAARVKTISVAGALASEAGQRLLLLARTDGASKHESFGVGPTEENDA